MKKYSGVDKLLTSLICGLLFMIIASPFLFATVTSLTEQFGLKIASKSGCPNNIGIIVHGIVFAIITRLMMGFN